MNQVWALQLLHYTSWANHRLATTLQSAAEELLLRDTDILRLMGHVLSAEQIWYRRIRQDSGPFDAWKQWPPAELPAAIEASCADWKTVLQAYPEPTEVFFEYHNLQGEPFRTSLADIWQHVCNHGTHHRAQVLTRLKQAGAASVPVLDYIAWTRTRR